MGSDDFTIFNLTNQTNGWFEGTYALTEFYSEKANHGSNGVNYAGGGQ